jgi:hypothetical protein
VIYVLLGKLSIWRNSVRWAVLKKSEALLEVSNDVCAIADR